MRTPPKSEVQLCCSAVVSYQLTTLRAVSKRGATIHATMIAAMHEDSTKRGLSTISDDPRFGALMARIEIGYYDGSLNA